MRNGAPARGSSPRSTVPVVGATMPVSMFTTVVLPAPLGPMRPRIWPGSTCSDTSSTATKPPKLTRRCSARSGPVDRRPTGAGVASTTSAGAAADVRAGTVATCGLLHSRPATVSASQSPRSPDGRRSNTASSTPARNRSGSPSTVGRSTPNHVGPSPANRNSSLPPVTSRVPAMAPETVRIPPTTSMASTRIDRSKLNWLGLIVPSDWVRSDPPRPTTAALTTSATKRTMRTSTPMAPAASSSSRAAWASRPVVV